MAKQKSLIFVSLKQFEKADFPIFLTECGIINRYLNSQSSENAKLFICWINFDIFSFPANPEQLWNEYSLIYSGDCGIVSVPVDFEKWCRINYFQ